MPLCPIDNVLTESDIHLMSHDITVITALNTLKNGTANEIRFTVNLENPVKYSLKRRMALDLYGIDEIPMRWLRGDMPPQTDTGADPFLNTYIVYLTDSRGVLIVDGEEMLIRKGSGVIFRQGLVHETRGTGHEPRLLLGPMSEHGFPVGAEELRRPEIIDRP